MKRNEFLKGVSLLGFGSVIPIPMAGANTGAAHATTGPCVLIPSETEGPFPLDLTTANSATFFRQDVREDRTGVRLNLRMKIIGVTDCLPMPNVRVNIWHCDKDGIYSGYNNAMNPGSTTATYLHGFQMTDAYGEVNFISIFPGWYTGRICHIHFQVYVSPVYKAVSQLTFPIAAKNALYWANSSLYTKGTDPTSLASDTIFADGSAYQVANLTANIDGSYSSAMEVTISSSGASTGIRDYEGETGGQFKLEQNFPNPHTGHTSIAFTLISSSDVQLNIHDLTAKKIRSIDRGNMPAGRHELLLDFGALGIARADYLYELQVSNRAGMFRQAKMMTSAR